MKAVILLSGGRSAATGNPAPPQAELSAIRLAVGLGAELIGLHAGPAAEAAKPALGHGLGVIRHIPMSGNADISTAIVAEITRIAPAIVLAGNRATGDGETGLLPYLLARALGWPILADAAHVSRDDDGEFTVEQALPRGLRRRLRQKGPLVVTVHPSAPAAMPYAFGQARRGRVDTVPAPSTQPDAAEEPALRPHRPRARIMRGAVSGGSAADRLKAATESASGGGDLMMDPDPEEAARAILAHLRRIGALPD